MLNLYGILDIRFGLRVMVSLYVIVYKLVDLCSNSYLNDSLEVFK